MKIARQMEAMVLEKQGQPLQHKLVPVPEPASEEVLIKVSACGVCRTDLHILDGELADPRLPLIPGHEVIGRVVGLGSAVSEWEIDALVGVPWLGYSCGKCTYCRKGKENLCENALFTGYTKNGGYTQYMVADARFCFPLAERLSGPESAPLLCAGLIGYRTYSMAGKAIEHLGMYGFGAAAHILTQLAIHQGKKVYAFTREGDTETQAFARSLGAVWAGSSTEAPPQPLDAALLFAPAGSLVPEALKNTDKGGTVVCGGIHMSDIPSFPYRLLWEERQLRSVANLSRSDGREFLKLAAEVPIKTSIHTYPLPEANQALKDLRKGKLQGAAVLLMPD